MLKRLVRATSNEDGFTTMELIVVSVLTLVVLAAIYNIFDTGMDNANLIDRNNRASRDVGKNLEIMSRYVRGTEGLDGPLETGDPSDYALSTRVDFDADGQYEYITFRLDGATKKLLVTYKQHDGSVSTQTYGENVLNQALMLPIFTYLDQNGTELTDPSERAARTASVKIRLIIDDDLSAPPRAFDTETMVMLRNSQN